MARWVRIIVGPLPATVLLLPLLFAEFRSGVCSREQSVSARSFGGRTLGGFACGNGAFGLGDGSWIGSGSTLDSGAGVTGDAEANAQSLVACRGAFGWIAGSGPLALAHG